MSASWGMIVSSFSSLCNKKLHTDLKENKFLVKTEELINEKEVPSTVHPAPHMLLLTLYLRVPSVSWLSLSFLILKMDSFDNNVFLVFLQVLQFFLLSVQLLYFTIYCLVTLSFFKESSSHHNTRLHNVDANNKSSDLHLIDEGISLDIGIKTIGLLFQVFLTLIAITVGLMSSVTSKLLHVQIYTGVNFILTALALVKYGIRMTDPVILVFNMSLLVLSFVILKEVTQRTSNHHRLRNIRHEFIQCPLHTDDKNRFFNMKNWRWIVW